MKGGWVEQEVRDVSLNRNVYRAVVISFPEFISIPIYLYIHLYGSNARAFRVVVKLIDGGNLVLQ